MSKTEFKKVYEVAKNHQYEVCNILEEQTFNVFHGFALTRDRKLATIEQAAYYLNYQCLCLNGSYDMQELENIREIYKRVDLLS